MRPSNAALTCISIAGPAPPAARPAPISVSEPVVLVEIATVVFGEGALAGEGFVRLGLRKTERGE
jgi:hypothetical protein